MAGGSNTEEGNVNIIPLLDVIFIFIFFLLMSVNFLEYFQITAQNPTEQAPPDEPPPPEDPKKNKQFKLLLSQEKIEMSQGMEETVLGTFTYDEAGVTRLKEFILQKKQENPDEKSMIIKPYKDVDFDKIVVAIDAAEQKINPKDKKSEKAFRNVAFETRTME